ncbi:MAG: phosphotyrosine protein phosphatase [Pseudomonadota bacterium]
MNVLFVCSANRLRSATAETIFHGYHGIEAIGAGTNRDAPTTVSGDLIEWANLIAVMEKTHRNRLNKKFGKILRNKRLVVLGIPDNYDYMEDELIALLNAKMSRFFSE